MNLEQQVISLDLAKRLNELGIKQESLFHWLMHDGVGEPECSGDIFIGYDKEKDYFVELASAFTVAELGEIIQWEKLYIFGFPEELKIFLNGKDSEADCRAKMLIYMIETKRIEV